METTFRLGFNYWPSNAGMYGWKHFDPEVVDSDLAMLASCGTNTIRIFPLWEDFQPIKAYYKYHNAPYEIRYTNDAPLPDTFEGLCGVDPEMIRRFGVLLDLAEKHHIKVIAALLTGWMSGRMFVPPVLESRNLMTDPLALKWEIRFLKYMVTTFKDHPAILAWEPGNECNCMSPHTLDQNYVWLHLITSTIRQFDPNHPVYSGMAVDIPTEGTETVLMHGEIFDSLITHPYNLFQQYCMLDAPLSFRSVMHMSMETALNRDIGGKPCFAEELGSLGPMFKGDSTAAKYIRLTMHEALAQGHDGYMWWNGFDQSKFDFPPYEWDAVERELGVINGKREPKIFAKEFQQFAELLKTQRLDGVEPPQADAVCILTEGQDKWAAAYGAWSLARQADLNLKFTVREKELPDSKLYLLPSVKGWEILPGTDWHRLIDKVKAGADLYISLGNKAMFSEFAEVAGMEVIGTQTVARQCAFSFAGAELHVAQNYFFDMKPLQARVLASDADGNPVLLENKCGKGRVIVLTVPMEVDIGTAFDKMSAPDADPYVEIYRYIAREILAEKAVKKHHRYLLKMDQKTADGRRFVVLGNPTKEEIRDTLTIEDGRKMTACTGDFEAVQNGSEISITIPSGDSGILFF